MFKSHLIFTLAFLVVLSAALIHKILHIKKKDYETYQELLISSNPEEHEELSKQTRKGICKEIWYQDKTPLHVHLESTDSELFFFSRDKQLNVIEQLEDIRCLVQEELYYLLPDGREALVQQNEELLIRGEDPTLEKSWISASMPGLIPMQLVRYFEAEKAFYDYNTKLLVADEVKLWQYRLEGHHPPPSFKEHIPLMQGAAHSIEITLKEKKFDFKAHQMHATFTSKEKLF
ncbi:MAG: hypothetical protein WAM28_04905 [Chlamydiales bacterium]